MTHIPSSFHGQMDTNGGRFTQFPGLCTGFVCLFLPMDREPDSLRKPDFHSFPNYKDFIFGSVDSEISDLYSEQENKAQENGSDCQFRPWDFLLLEESKTPATKSITQLAEK
ncbi:hypothetical protein IRJ41_025867 [Triplophysa rosa]|uniref:Uncharacterized protein n=1 Tax=Triplophysa rosa TaxID=992332 RepID=A0A9W7WPP9_TRIRA|nr:hypothetical protein IRJ41_025867 [Triplophysa rosa]